MWRSPSRPDPTTRGSALLLAVAIFFTVLAGGGCSCDTLCDGNPADLVFTGELLGVDGDIVTFAGPDGDIDIGVVENVGFLDIGESYRVAARADAWTTVDYTTHVNAQCATCDEINIVHADGQRVDTGWWRTVKETGVFQWGLVLFLGVPVATLVLVAANRARRGARYDGIDDLPEDGEWVEYDDLDDDWDEYADDTGHHDDEPDSPRAGG